jgi:hypothetical protein
MGNETILCPSKINVYPTAFYVRSGTESILTKGRLKLVPKSTYFASLKDFPVEIGSKEVSSYLIMAIRRLK